MRISTQNIACSQRQMYTCIYHSVIHYEHTTCKSGSRTSDQFNTNNGEKKKRKKEAVSAYLIKNSKGGGTITSNWKDWAEYYVTVHLM